jgi:hypothetical protein
MIKKYNDLIILAIIWIVSLYSVIVAIVTPYDILIQNYIGYALLIGISILRFFKIKWFKTILGILLVIGSFNAIQYTYATVTFVFTWTPMGHRFSSFGIQPLSISLLILLIVLNFSDFIRFVNGFFSEDPQIAIERQKRITEKLYNELKNERDDKLNDIIANKGMYQVDYVKAAQRLIEERKEK